MPQTFLICSPDDGDFCWWNLQTWIDALQRQDDILTTQERSDTLALWSELNTAYPEPDPPAPQTTPRIRIDTAKIAELRDRIKAAVGRLHDMMSAAHKAQANALIDSLKNSHP